jgi:hypothetical protein
MLLCFQYVQSSFHQMQILHQHGTNCNRSDNISSKDSLYFETGWETLVNRRETRKLTTFYKIHNKLCPPYLFNQNIFFSNIGNQNIFLEKKHNPPPSS